jgi:Tfp pilus assembly protein PilE
VVDAAALQEKWYFQQNQYTDDEDDLNGNLSPEAFYSVAVNQLSCAGDGSCFQVVATAVGDQLQDLSCRTFVIDQTGDKTATDSNGGDATAVCW